jgi:hypothetical protein
MCIFLYTLCYYIFPTDISILQTTIDFFTFDLLTSRQPIVISDYLQNPEEIINSWFKYNIINHNEEYNEEYNEDNNNDTDWKQNNNKFLFINATEDTEVIIYKAQRTKENPPEDSKIIIIKLEKNQSLILPFKWKYYGNKIDKWEIDDFITFFVGRIF